MGPDDGKLVQITGDAVRASIEYAASGEAVALHWDQGEMAFAYDELGRLTGVSSADESIQYPYTPGEPDIRVQLDRYTRVGLSGRIDTGSAIGSDWELLRNRTRAAPYEHLYFDSGTGEFRMVTDLGVVMPGALVEDSLERMRVLGEAGATPRFASLRVTGTTKSRYSGSKFTICPILFTSRINVTFQPELSVRSATDRSKPWKELR